jgi:hypothetical protein
MAIDTTLGTLIVDATGPAAAAPMTLRIPSLPGFVAPAGLVPGVAVPVPAGSYEVEVSIGVLTTDPARFTVRIETGRQTRAGLACSGTTCTATVGAPAPATAADVAADGGPFDATACFTAFWALPPDKRRGLLEAFLAGRGLSDASCALDDAASDDTARRSACAGWLVSWPVETRRAFAQTIGCSAAGTGTAAEAGPDMAACVAAFTSLAPERRRSVLAAFVAAHSDLQAAVGTACAIDDVASTDKARLDGCLGWVTGSWTADLRTAFCASVMASATGTGERTPSVVEAPAAKAPVEHCGTLPADQLAGKGLSVGTAEHLCEGARLVNDRGEVFPVQWQGDHLVLGPKLLAASGTVGIGDFAADAPDLLARARQYLAWLPADVGARVRAEVGDDPAKLAQQYLTEVLAVARTGHLSLASGPGATAAVVPAFVKVPTRAFTMDDLLPIISGFRTGSATSALAATVPSTPAEMQVTLRDRWSNLSGSSKALVGAAGLAGVGAAAALAWRVARRKVGAGMTKDPGRQAGARKKG